VDVPKAAKRAPRGQRREQFLAVVTDSPGIKASEVAKQLGISPNQAYALARGLQKDRAIRKSGKGYRLSKKAGASK
jgi:DNA-binding IclR family transcriptional regulator